MVRSSWAVSDRHYGEPTSARATRRDELRPLGHPRRGGTGTTTWFDTVTYQYTNVSRGGCHLRHRPTCTSERCNPRPRRLRGRTPGLAPAGRLEVFAEKDQAGHRRRFVGRPGSPGASTELLEHRRGLLRRLRGPADRMLAAGAIEAVPRGSSRGPHGILRPPPFGRRYLSRVRAARAATRRPGGARRPQPAVPPELCSTSSATPARRAPGDDPRAGHRTAVALYMHSIAQAPGRATLGPEGCSTCPQVVLGLSNSRLSAPARA
jgi:hypothetical protein